jgi:4a-hydroxytetrahydrobiopterin dehydratase
MKNSAESHTKNALLNILAFPGLGSLRSGRWVAGIGQLVFVLSGTALVLIWVFKELSQYYDLMFGDVKPQSFGWIGITGAILFGISWLWAGITSLSLFRAASSAASKPVAVPPQLVPVENMKPVTAKIQAALATLPQWKRTGQVISRTYKFADFPEAMKFVNAVAELAEQAQHHPDIDVRWNKVTLALTSHEAGGLTEKDFALAHACDAQSFG